jgi:hypothetical protein
MDRRATPRTIQELFADKVTIAIPDPVYPVSSTPT